MKTEDKNNYKGIAGTVIFHGLLLVLFLFFGFKTPLPLPAEQGIAINFGTSDDGMGDVQPDQAADSQDQNDEPAASTSSSSSSSEKNVATQETEEAPALRPVTKPSQRPKPVTESTKPAETPVEDPKPKVNPRALYQRVGAGSTGGSQGETGNPGDQGKVNGSKDTNRQGDGSTGGLTGSPDFSMAGRTLTQKPTISDQSQTEGKIIVTVVVNSRGEVLSAKAGARGTTLSNSSIQRKCEDAALRARFSPSDREEQTGTITFIFKLQ
jgi:outer membrane biosynthesis protein TonB